MLGDFLATCAHVCILFSQKGVSLSRIMFTCVYGCVGVGQLSSSVVIGIEEVREEDISFPDHIYFRSSEGMEVCGEEGSDVACDD